MFSTRALLLLCLSLAPFTLAVTYITDNGLRTAPVFPQALKSYDINLDSSYEEQWRPIMADFEQPLTAFIKSLGINANRTLEFLDYFDYPIVKAYNKAFAKEVKAISSLIGLSFTEVALLNLIYDITAQCTSILVQDPQGNVFHGRNLDFPWTPDLSKMIFHGRYFKNGALLYEAVSLVAYTGLITGVKPGAYSFSIDQYVLPRNQTKWDIFENGALDILQILRGKLSPPKVVKNAFETIPDYEGFVEHLKKTDTVSRAFYIVAGTQPDQGVVITKYRNSVENVTTLDADAGRWYVAQSNYIGNIPDPEFDNRASAARDWLDTLGRDKLTKQVLLDEVMSQYPVFNNETIHTTLMQPSTGYFNTTLWGW